MRSQYCSKSCFIWKEFLVETQRVCVGLVAFNLVLLASISMAHPRSIMASLRAVWSCNVFSAQRRSTLWRYRVHVGRFLRSCCVVSAARRGRWFSCRFGSLVEFEARLRSSSEHISLAVVARSFSATVGARLRSSSEHMVAITRGADYFAV